MQHKYCFDPVSKTLNDICNVEAGKQFGNIAIVLGVDFAQIVPVGPHGSRGSIVNACIQFSQLWLNFQLHCTNNICILHNYSNTEFVNFLSTMSYQHTLDQNLKLPSAKSHPASDVLLRPHSQSIDWASCVSCASCASCASCSSCTSFASCASCASCASYASWPPVRPVRRVLRRHICLCLVRVNTLLSTVFRPYTCN